MGRQYKISDLLHGLGPDWREAMYGYIAGAGTGSWPRRYQLFLKAAQDIGWKATLLIRDFSLFAHGQRRLVKPCQPK